MDIFPLTDDGTTYNNGLIINGLKSKLWIERFREPGEFTIVTTPTEYMLDVLAIGTLLSHTDTYAVMKVEDHEITDNKDGQSELTVTGRGLDAFLEKRVATDDDLGFEPSAADGSSHPYTLPDAMPWQQAVTLMNKQISSSAIRAQFILPHVSVGHDFVFTPEMKISHPDWFDTDEREIKRGPLSAAVIAILHEIDGGLKVVRPNASNVTDIKFLVTMGEDKTQTVQFSYEAGDLETARYYWSDKGFRNAAYVQGRYQGKFVWKSGPTGWSRQVMLVEATDLTINPGEAGWAGVAQEAKLDAMLTRRGNIRIRRAKKTELIEATVSKTSKYRYGLDYDLGDKVWVRGNYGVSKAMRITEHAQSEDETGEFGFPTLSPINP